MKRALISDIHSNVEALTAVLEDIRQEGCEEIYCLGDVVGYGPNPRECIDLVKANCDVCILGNHDQGALFDPEGFHAAAEQAIFWTRDQLEDYESPTAIARWDFLGERPRAKREEGLLFVHGSPRNPLNEYVFPEDIYDRRKLEKIFALVQKCCFEGHTHVPGVFTENMEFFTPEDMEYWYPIGDTKLLVNVGSVGQPRDGDPRSCYAILEDDKIRYRRVEYPWQETAEKIFRIPELDDHFGHRLGQGR